MTTESIFPEGKNFPPAIEQSRRYILESALSGIPIEFERRDAQGDSYIIAAAIDHAVQSFLGTHTTQDTKVTYTASIGKGRFSTQHVPNRPTDYHFYKDQLYAAFFMLGLGKPPESLLDSTPHIVPFANGPLATYDAQKVEKFAKQFQKSSSKNHIVIVQSGSVNAKRYTAENIHILADAITAAHPDVPISVATDAHFHPHEPLVTPSSNMQVIEAHDPNTLLGLYKSARLIITTDTYWAWLAGGVDPTKVIELFTVADPKKWAIPGATVVQEYDMQEQHQEGLYDVETGTVDPSVYFALRKGSSRLSEEEAAQVSIDSADVVHVAHLAIERLRG